MTPMIPKISVRPLATRKSSRPYWTALRHWTRKVAVSIVPLRARDARWRERPPRARPPGLELAAARRVGERLHRHRAELVVVALDLAQVDVLHRVAGRREGELAARAVDRALPHRGGELV